MFEKVRPAVLELAALAAIVGLGLASGWHPAIGQTMWPLMFGIVGWVAVVRGEKFADVFGKLWNRGGSRKTHGPGS
jgi:hypothetical protein